MRFQPDLAECSLILLQILLQQIEEGLCLLWTQIDALKVLNGNRLRRGLVNDAKEQEEVPKAHTHLNTVGITLAIVGGVRELESGRRLAWSHFSSIHRRESYTKPMMIYLLLIAAAFAAGAINAVAGGGSFLTFPSLVFAGVPAVIANASNTVALVPGAMASALAYRDDVQRLNEQRLKLWFIVSLLGGALGAALLLFTSDRAFRLVAPWLLLFATLLFAFGNQVSLALRGRLHSNQTSMLILLVPIAVYGGYFGGGIGIMFLAALRLYGFTEIHGMNGIKTILGGALNAIAAVIFIVAHQVDWRPTLIMMAAAIAGGYVGPIVARRVRPAVIRGFVVGVGLCMTAYFFYIAPK